MVHPTFRKQVVTVRNGDAFVSLYPEDTLRLTVGIDHSEDAEVRWDGTFSGLRFLANSKRFDHANPFYF